MPVTLRQAAVLIFLVMSQSAFAAQADPSPWSAAPPQCAPALAQMSRDLEWVRTNPFAYAGKYSITDLVVGKLAGLDDRGAAKFTWQRTDPVIESGRTAYTSSAVTERCELTPSVLPESVALAMGTKQGVPYGFWCDQAKSISLRGGKGVSVITGEQMLRDTDDNGLPVLSVHRFFDRWLTAPWSPKRLNYLKSNGWPGAALAVKIAEPNEDGFSEGESDDVVLVGQLENKGYIRDKMYWRLGRGSIGDRTSLHTSATMVPRECASC